MDGNIIVGLVIAVMVIAAACCLINNRLKGKCSCGCSCGACGRCGKNVNVEDEPEEKDQ